MMQNLLDMIVNSKVYPIDKDRVEISIMLILVTEIILIILYIEVIKK